MTFESLECFAAIAQGATFLDTAEDFNLSQSALSKHIKKMEEELGVKLFVRAGRSVKVTKAGEMLLKDYLAMEPYYRTLVTHMHQMSGKREIRIALGMPGGSLHITDVLEIFRSEHPEIPLVIMRQGRNRIQYAEDIFLAKEADYLIMHSLGEQKKQRQIILMEDDPIWVFLPLGHPLTEKESLTFEDIRNEKFLLNAWSKDILQLLSKRYQVLFRDTREIAPKRDNILWNVAAGKGITIMHRSDVAEVLTNRVAVRPLAELPKCPVVLVSNPEMAVTEKHRILQNFLISAVQREIESYSF